MRPTFLLLLLAFAACGPQIVDEPQLEDFEAGKADWIGSSSTNGLGAAYDSSGNVRFRVFSSRATRVQVELYAAALGADPVASLPLTRDPAGSWTVKVTASALKKAGLTSTI